jgi:membrane protein YdfJ
MDYEVFLVSRMREEFTHSKDAKKAILAGLKDSGEVVTAAGLIMISVFTGFMLAPDPIIKSMGFALTFGIVFDAFIVRMALVPAVMTIMGKAAWYMPRWLEKILPNIDVEGTTIQTEVDKKTLNNKKKHSTQIETDRVSELRRP